MMIVIILFRCVFQVVLEMSLDRTCPDKQVQVGLF